MLHSAVTRPWFSLSRDGHCPGLGHPHPPAPTPSPHPTPQLPCPSLPFWSSLEVPGLKMRTLREDTGHPRVPEPAVIPGQLWWLHEHNVSGTLET